MSDVVGPTEITPGLPTSPAVGEGWTVDLLEQLPDDGLRYEMIDGLLIVNPPAGEDWTVDLLERLPDDGLVCEIIDGLLIVSPIPEPRQRHASGRLSRILEDNCPEDRAVVVAPLVWQPDRRTPCNPISWSSRRTASVRRTSPKPRCWSSKCCPPAHLVTTAP